MPHPLNQQLKIDFSVNPIVYSIEIPYGNEVVNKVICPIEDTGWAGAWDKVGAILIDHMNKNCSNSKIKEPDNVQASLTNCRVDNSSTNSKCGEFKAHFLDSDFNRSYSVVPEFEPIRICRTGEEDLYYEINGAGAFFYCTFKFNGRYINACLSYAECSDWDDARNLARQFIMDYSLYHEILDKQYSRNPYDEYGINFNLAETWLFLSNNKEDGDPYCGFEELCFDVTGIY